MGVESLIAFAVNVAIAVTASIAVGYITQAINGGPKDPEANAGDETSPEFLDALRTAIDPDAPRRLIFGRRRVGGNIIFSGKSGNYTVYVTEVAGHPITAFEGVYIDNRKVEIDATTKLVRTAPFNGAIYVELYDGTQTEASAWLMERFPDRWTDRHIGYNTAYAIIAMNPVGFPSAFQGGNPDVTYDVRGAQIYDPRTGEVGYSANSALVMAWYWTHPLGYGKPLSTLDLNQVSRDADICDQLVERLDGTTEKRYSCHGVADTDMRREEVLAEMGYTCAGGIIPMADKVPTFVGKWDDPEIGAQISEDDLASEGLEFQDHVSFEDRYNGVRGKFVSQADGYEEKDYPPYQHADYLARDGETLDMDLSFRYVTSPSQAQRLAKISLLALREGIPLSAHCKPHKINIVAGDMVTVSDSFANLNGETFRVIKDTINPDNSIRLDMKRESPSWYTWDPATEEKEYVAGNPTGDSLRLISSAGFKVSVSGTAGARKATIDIYESTGSVNYIVEFRPSSSDTWTVGAVTRGPTVPNVVLNVNDATDYFVRVITEGDGVLSEYTESSVFNTGTNGDKVDIPAAPAPPIIVNDNDKTFAVRVEPPAGTALNQIELQYKEPDSDVWTTIATSAGGTLNHTRNEVLKAYGWSYMRARVRTTASVYSNWSPELSIFKVDPAGTNTGNTDGSGAVVHAPLEPTLSVETVEGVPVVTITPVHPSTGGPWVGQKVIYRSPSMGAAETLTSAPFKVQMTEDGWYYFKSRSQDGAGNFSAYSPMKSYRNNV